METGLRNRVAVVAGSSQGLGKATAFALAAEGAHVALCSRSAQKLEQVAKEIRERFGVNTYAEAFDAASTEATNHFIQNTHRLFDRIDVCVTNAGGPPAKDFLEAADADWDSAFALNLRSAVAFGRAVIPIMQKQRWGRIITISSITVKQPQPHLVLSNAVRAGVAGLVRSLANDYGKDGITVNNVGPGYTATERLLELLRHRVKSTGKTEEEVRKVWLDQVPVGRLGEPEELADTIVWLASERASYVTGQTILVDGGLYKGL